MYIYKNPLELLALKKGGAIINFKKILKKHKIILGLLIILILFQMIISTIFPYLTKFIIDDVLLKQNLKNLRRFLLITIVLITLQIPLNILVSYFCSKWSQLVIFDIRESLGNRVFSVKENSKDNGLFINTISNDCEVIGNELLAITLNSLPNLMLIILYLLVLLNLNLKLTIITLASIPMFVLISYITSKKVFSLTKELQQFRDKLIEFLNSYVRNKLIIDLYGIKDEEKNKFSDITRQVRDVNVKTSTILATLNNISSLLAVVTPLLILFIGSVLTIKREITLGTLVAFNSYTSLLFIPLTKLLNIPPMLSQLKVSVDRIKQSNFPNLHQEIGKYEEVSNLTENEQLIVKELNILIEDKYLLKKTLSFQINKGDVIEIQGPNGIGKSILLRSLINYHTNFIGTITKRSQLNIVYVPQENFLFEGTVRSNLCKGIYKYDELELQKLIELVKFDVPLDKKVTPFSMNLSSGQLQKIKIVRALLSKPEVLLLDETLANLDPLVVKNLLEYFYRLKTTIVFIYHGKIKWNFQNSDYKIINLEDFK